MHRQPPPTRPTLLGALREGLRWEEFVALYGRTILAWARSDFGLQPSDADNLCQEVLLGVWRGIRTFDPARGRFRAWLYTCAHHAACNLRRGRSCEQSGAPPIRWNAESFVPDEGDLGIALARLEENGFGMDMLERAVAAVRNRVQPATWKAFLLCECFELTAKEAGALLHMQPVAVNQAVFRVRQMLRQVVASISNHGRPATRAVR
jgi:RNA polymerase sigma factor (sigma-70 family)